MNKLTIEMDPLSKFEDVEMARLAEACGILPVWALQALPEDTTMRQAVTLAYQFPIHEMTGGSIAEDGTHSYPEDPDLYPYMKLTLGEETMFIYAHAIVAFTNQQAGSTFITRMD